MIQMTRTTLALIAIVGAGGLVPVKAQAQGAPGPEHQDGFQFELGAGAFVGPDYKGSNDYRVMPLPFASIRYTRGDRYVALDGPGLNANIVSGGDFELGPLITFEMGRDNDIENRTVRRLGEVDDAIMAGIFASKRIDLGGPGGIEVGAQVLTDVSGANDGMTAKFEVGYNRFLSQRTMLMIGASTSWADEKYMQAYFGVTPAGAAASGLPTYTAGSGVENVELSAGLMYRINERWSALGMVNYQRLLDTAADSPIVQLEGSEDQAGIMFGVSRSF
ncbi:MipA/OmpV family protein [Hyphomonas sp.]|uniref:MipA/OmpV family protein n=1 Tax=Hyphomonas sp. TaxID=87 RepID=UPI0032D8B9AF